MTAWVCAIILGTILTAGTLRILNLTSKEIGQSHKPIEDSNHFSVQWMGFSPTDYSNLYPDYYICINDLAESTLTMQIALQILNQEAYGYYFLIEQNSAPPAGWTISTFYIGYIDVDETLTFVYSDIERTKPGSISGGVLTESVDLVAKAYWDSSYTNLYSQDNFAVTFNFIDRTAAVWNQLYNSDFDDASVQGWSHIGSGNLIVSSTYYRSFQYSLRLYSNDVWGAAYRKSFDVTGPYAEAYLIFSLRSTNWEYPVSGYGITPRISFDGTTYFRPDVIPSTDKWYQFIIPIPVGTSTQVDIYAVCRDDTAFKHYAYLDDVFLIAK